MTISVIDGEEVSAAVTNDKLISRRATSSNKVTGIINLDNTTNVLSGPEIVNLQQAVNETTVLSNANELDIADLRATTGTADGDTTMPNFTTPGVITNPSTTFSGMEELNISLQANNDETTSLRTLSGTTALDDDLGVFSGTTIVEPATIKSALQDLETEVELKEDLANKGVANGYCPLNGSTLIDAVYLPSFVDDVLEFANLAAFPVTGETGKIYVALDTNKTYRWSGATYIILNEGGVISINGLSGVVTLDLDDVNDVDAAAPITGDVLTYNNISGNWEAQAPSSSVNVLDDLTDVVITAPSATQVLKYNGTNWINDTDAGGATQLSELSDVDAALTPNTNDVLTYDGAEWTSLPASGSGLRNFISPSDSDFESGIGSWVTFDDGASFVDGTGGAPSAITIAPTINGAEVLEKTGSLKISKSAASGLGEGTSVVTTTVDRAARGKINYVTFQYDATSTNYVANDLVIKLYDVTNPGEISPLSTIIGLDKAKTDFFLPFLMPANCLVMRVAVFCNTTNALAYDVIIDKVSVSNQTLEVAINDIGTWQAFTPTISSLTNVSVNKGWYRRVGQNIEVRGFALYNGVGATTDFTVTLPFGLTIDTTTAGDTTLAANNFNQGLWYDDVGGQTNFYMAEYSGSPTLIFFRRGSVINSNVFANNDRFAYNFSVPVNEYRGLTTTGLVQNSQLTTLSATSAVKTPVATAHYHLHTGNSVTLKAGRDYEIHGSAFFTNGGSSPVYSNLLVSLSNVNGADSGGFPGSGLSISSLQILSAGELAYTSQATGTFAFNRLHTPVAKVRCLADVTIFCITYAEMTTASNARITVFITATEQSFSATAIVQQNKVATIRHQLSSGVNAGDSVAGTRVDRPLNTLNDPYGLVTSLASPLFTPTKGIYHIQASCPGHRVNKHQISLTTSAGTLVVIGSAEEMDNADFSTTRAMLSGIFTADGSTSYKIRHYTQSTTITGLGRAAASGDPEVYTIVTLTKIAE